MIRSSFAKAPTSAEASSFAKAPTSAEASSFAKATEDEPED